MDDFFKEQIAVHRNVREGEDDFGMDHPCDYCDNFVGHVADLPGTNKWICKGCLSELIKAIDQKMNESFQPDFERSRK